MIRSSFIIISQEYKALIKDIFWEMEDTARKRKKRLSHLRFAKPALYGWSFFKKRQPSWEVLEEIMHRVSVLHPHYKKGIIAHILSEIVNMTKTDLTRLQAEL